MCALALDASVKEEDPRAFALITMTPALQEQVDSAYEQLACGVSGAVEIPVAVPLVMHPCVLRKLEAEPFTFSSALGAMLHMLCITGEYYTVGQKTVDAFMRVAGPAGRTNAVLIVSRHQPPRLKTLVRGGRHRYSSPPIRQMEPRSWPAKTMPGLRPIAAVAA